MQYVISFLEGVVTFISPCLLPMLPIYISYFAGGAERSTAKTLRCALGFVLGFTVVFVAMGALAGTVGSFFIRYQTIVNIVLGGIVVLFGLNGVLCGGEMEGVAVTVLALAGGCGAAVLLRLGKGGGRKRRRRGKNR